MEGRRLVKDFYDQPPKYDPVFEEGKAMERDHRLNGGSLLSIRPVSIERTKSSASSSPNSKQTIPLMSRSTKICTVRSYYLKPFTASMLLSSTALPLFRRSVAHFYLFFKWENKSHKWEPLFQGNGYGVVINPRNVDNGWKVCIKIFTHCVYWHVMSYLRCRSC